VATAVASDYPDIVFETLIVDDFAHRLVSGRQSFEVVVLQNLHGDVLSDASRSLRGAIDAVYAEGRHLTPDQGGTFTARAFCEAVWGRLR
jgi:isocitrate/isopropylmalate dehydrogenase